MRIKNIAYIILLVSLAVDALAINPGQFIDSVKQKVINKNIEDAANKENGSIKEFINNISSLPEDQKIKLAEFRFEQTYYLDILTRKFDSLPKDVQVLLKEEKRLRSTISPKGQDDLNNYIKDATKK